MTAVLGLLGKSHYYRLHNCLTYCECCQRAYQMNQCRDQMISTLILTDLQTQVFLFGVVYLCATAVTCVKRLRLCSQTT